MTAVRRWSKQREHTTEWWHQLMACTLQSCCVSLQQTLGRCWMPEDGFTDVCTMCAVYLLCHALVVLTPANVADGAARRAAISTYITHSTSNQGRFSHVGCSSRSWLAHQPAAGTHHTHVHGDLTSANSIENVCYVHHVGCGKEV